MTAPELSIVVPAFNEAANLPPLVERLATGMDAIGCTCEIIVVDDGSTDDTAAKVRELAQRYPWLRTIALARNFGKEAALAAGMEAAAGRGVLFIDADLQHPPELAQRMVAAWRGGAEVVNAVKRARGTESWLYRGCAALFNRGMSQALRFDMRGASDYKLLDRSVIQALLDCPERVRFFRAMVAWVGFTRAQVEFDVAERHAGRSAWSGGGLLRYTLRNLLAFSSAPLRWVALTGFAFSLLSFVLLLQTLYRYFFGQVAVGFTTVITLQVILGGVILSALGIIAAYIALIYEEVKRRPMYVVKRPQARRTASPAP
jgi:polyisoprenyl-phosphate glycosyltransferase